MLEIIDNYDSFTYNLYQYIAEFYDDIQVIRNDHLSVAEVCALQPAALILSPGPGTPTQAGISVELIRECSGSIPMLGVCLGHQAIAAAFGGQVSVAPTIVHGKADQIFHQSTGLYQSIESPFAAGRYHSLMVMRDNFPACLTIDAESADGLIMGLRHRQHATFGVQFHPESILSQRGKTCLQNFLREAQLC